LNNIFLWLYSVATLPPKLNWSRTALNTLQKSIRIAAHLFDVRDFLRLQYPAALVPALVPVRITATASSRRTRRPGASTAFVSTAR
jgi:hypothetical protein